MSSPIFLLNLTTSYLVTHQRSTLSIFLKRCPNVACRRRLMWRVHLPRMSDMQTVAPIHLCNLSSEYQIRNLQGSLVRL